MSENSIPPISSVQPTETGATSSAASSHQAESTKGQKPASLEQNKTPRQKESEPAVANDLSNISISFRIDAKTQELTVFVIDRASKRVLRSIPSSELQKMKAGDLLKLIA